MGEHSFAAQVMEALETFTTEVTEGVNVEAKRCAKGLTSDLRTASPSRTGNYARSWKNRVTGVSDSGSEEHTVYNQDHYRLTHLLENGHGAGYNQSGPVKSFPHIGPLADRWQDDFSGACEEVIRRNAK